MEQPGIHEYFDNYTPVGDVTVMAICLLIAVLVFTSYVKKTRSYKIFLNLLVYLFAAAFVNLLYHQIYSNVTNGDYRWVYILRCGYHALLFSNLLLYVVYIVELQHLEPPKKIPTMIVSTGLYILVIVSDIVTTVNGKSFKLTARGNAVTGLNIFLWGYLGFIAIIIFLMIINRKRLYKRVMLGFYGTMMLAFILLYLQGMWNQNSYTVVSFLFPVIAMFYLVHSNPYDIELGAVDARALEDLVSYNYDKKREMILMSMYLPDFDEEGATFSEDIQQSI